MSNQVRRPQQVVVIETLDRRPGSSEQVGREGPDSPGANNRYLLFLNCLSIRSGAKKERLRTLRTQSYKVVGALPRLWRSRDYRRSNHAGLNCARGA